MSAWVVVIGKEQRANWDIALDNHLWASKKCKEVKSGDDIFFWQAPDGLISRCRAASDAMRVADPILLPWPDSAEKQYRHAFGIVQIGSRNTPFGPWTALQHRGGFTAQARNAVIPVPASHVAALRALFPGTDEPSLDELARGRAEAERARVASDEDARRFAAYTRAIREGRPAFRQALLLAYQDRCAISRFDVIEALEAAHIVPYKGAHTNDVANGLLLRADLHTLFDRHLLTVDATTLQVRLHPNLQGSTYGTLEERSIFVPTSPESQPGPDYLSQHNSECSWFVT